MLSQSVCVSGQTSMRLRMLTIVSLLHVLGFASRLWAQSNVHYVYDALGRLTQVIDPTGNTATYNYDVVLGAQLYGRKSTCQ